MIVDDQFASSFFVSGSLMSFLDSLRQQDPAAADLYQHLTEVVGIAPESFDQGVASLNLATPSEPEFSWKGKGNRQTSVPEVIRKSLEQISLEIFEGPFLGEVVEELGFIPSWIFTDMDPDTTEDKEVFDRIKEIVTDVSDTVNSEKFSSQEKYVEDKMTGLVEAVFEEWPSLYNKEAPTAENAVDMLKKPEKNCLEITILFYTIFSLAGLKPQIIKLRLDEEGKSMNHIILGIPIDSENNGKLLFFDFGNNNYIGPAYEDKMWHPLGLNELVAEYLINRFYGAPFAGPQEKEELLLKAFQLAPDYFRCSYHLADFYEKREALDKALEYYQIAWENSHHPDVFEKITELKALKAIQQP